MLQRIGKNGRWCCGLWMRERMESGRLCRISSAASFRHQTSPSDTMRTNLRGAEDTQKLQVAAAKARSARVSRVGKSYEELVEPFRVYLGKATLERGEVLGDLSIEVMEELLEVEDRRVKTGMFAHADTVTERFFGRKIHFRGLIEFSNVCRKDCLYCGIRHSMEKGLVHRYTMPVDEIIETALWAYDHDYGSVMLQSGELPTEGRLSGLERAIRTVKKETRKRESEATGKPLVECRGLGIALSLGELSTAWYERLFRAGAHRYLLRIESSTPELYQTIHPNNDLHSWQTRHGCLQSLLHIGYQVGTGVMIGLPGQTLHHLAKDISYFRQHDYDMVGMGPYVVQEHTPLGKRWLAERPTWYEDAQLRAKHDTWIFDLSTRMLALTRIHCGNVNLAATTALQAINPGGREIAITRGANLLMPILTPETYRADYQIYENKPCIDEGAEDCRGCLTARIGMAGKEIAWGEWGDPPHFFGSQASVHG